MKKVLNIINKNKLSIITLISLGIFLFLMIEINIDDSLVLDNIIYQYISKFINPNNTNIMKIITWFGSTIPLIIISLIVFIKNKKYGKFLLINLLSITAFNQLLKFIIKRPRPSINTLIEETGFSFPSGHSMVSLAIYGLVIYFIYKNIKNKYIKYTLIIILSLLILLIGISRIYLGVHYPSDVIGGFFISFCYLYLIINLYKLEYLDSKNKR